MRSMLGTHNQIRWIEKIEWKSRGTIHSSLICTVTEANIQSDWENLGIKIHGWRQYGKSLAI